MYVVCVLGPTGVDDPNDWICIHIFVILLSLDLLKVLGDYKSCKILTFKQQTLGDPKFFIM